MAPKTAIPTIAPPPAERDRWKAIWEKRKGRDGYFEWFDTKSRMREEIAALLAGREPPAAPDTSSWDPTHPSVGRYGAAATVKKWRNARTVTTLTWRDGGV